MADNKVLSFIDEVNKEKATAASQSAYMNTPAFKKKQLDSNMAQAKDDCMQYIFADLYKNSLPLDDSYINCNDQKLTDDMNDFINRQTANRGMDCYIREAIKRGNKSIEQVVESVNRFVGNCFREKVANYGTLDAEDLNWKFDEGKKAKLDEISADANLDQVARYVNQNVTAATEYEKNKIIQRKDEQKKLQDELNGNDSLTSESAIDRYLAMHGQSPVMKAVYQPSLFEGVMISKFNQNDTSTREGQVKAYNEAVGEYTLLNMTKALRVKDYSISEIKNLAKEYSRQ